MTSADEPKKYEEGEAKHATAWLTLLQITRYYNQQLTKDFSILEAPEGDIILQARDDKGGKITLRLSEAEVAQVATTLLALSMRRLLK